jgi:Raf kinase inhibitor-like YbhB/YbcL family protein
MKLMLMAAVAAAVLVAAPACARGPITSQRPETATSGTLTVASPAFRADGVIPQQYSADGGNVSPPLSWSAAPGARSYAIVVEDTDAPMPTPLAHWVVWNIPGSVTQIPEGLKTGAVQGRNGHGETGYAGPRPPTGDPPHHYHFQVFALDRTLDVPPSADREKLLPAFRGHVLAKGELIGTYQVVKSG